MIAGGKKISDAAGGGKGPVQNYPEFDAKLWSDRTPPRGKDTAADKFQKESPGLPENLSAQQTSQRAALFGDGALASYSRKTQDAASASGAQSPAEEQQKKVEDLKNYAAEIAKTRELIKKAFNAWFRAEVKEKEFKVTSSFRSIYNFVFGGKEITDPLNSVDHDTLAAWRDRIGKLEQSLRLARAAIKNAEQGYAISSGISEDTLYADSTLLRLSEMERLGAPPTFEDEAALELTRMKRFESAGNWMAALESYAALQSSYIDHMPEIMNLPYDGGRSLTYEINTLISKGVIKTSLPLVATSKDLESVKKDIEQSNLELARELGTRNGPELGDRGYINMKRVDTEIARLMSIENRKPESYGPIEEVEKFAHRIVDSHRGNPEFERRTAFFRGVGNLMNDPAFYIMILSGYASIAVGSWAEARLVAMGLQGRRLEAATAAIGGVTFHDTINLGNLVIARPEHIDLSLGGHLRSIGMLWWLGRIQKWYGMKVMPRYADLMKLDPPLFKTLNLIGTKSAEVAGLASLGLGFCVGQNGFNCLTLDNVQAQFIESAQFVVAMGVAHAGRSPAKENSVERGLELAKERFLNEGERLKALRRKLLDDTSDETSAEFAAQEKKTALAGVRMLGALETFLTKQAEGIEQQGNMAFNRRDPNVAEIYKKARADVDSEIQRVKDLRSKVERFVDDYKPFTFARQTAGESGSAVVPRPASRISLFAGPEALPKVAELPKPSHPTPPNVMQDDLAVRRRKKRRPDIAALGKAMEAAIDEPGERTGKVVNAASKGKRPKHGHKSRVKRQAERDKIIAAAIEPKPRTLLPAVDPAKMEVGREHVRTTLGDAYAGAAKKIDSWPEDVRLRFYDRMGTPDIVFTQDFKRSERLPVNKDILSAIRDVDEFNRSLSEDIDPGKPFRRISATPRQAAEFDRNFRPTVSGTVEFSFEGRTVSIDRGVLQKMSAWAKNYSLDLTVETHGHFEYRVEGDEVVIENFVPTGSYSESLYYLRGKASSEVVGGAEGMDRLLAQGQMRTLSVNQNLMDTARYFFDFDVDPKYLANKGRDPNWSSDFHSHFTASSYKLEPSPPDTFSAARSNSPVPWFLWTPGTDGSADHLIVYNGKTNDTYRLSGDTFELVPLEKPAAEPPDAAPPPPTPPPEKVEPTEGTSGIIAREGDLVVVEDADKKLVVMQDVGGALKQVQRGYYYFEAAELLVALTGGSPKPARIITAETGEYKAGTPADRVTLFESGGELFALAGQGAKRDSVGRYYFKSLGKYYFGRKLFDAIVVNRDGRTRADQAIADEIGRREPDSVVLLEEKDGEFWPLEDATYLDTGLKVEDGFGRIVSVARIEKRPNDTERDVMSADVSAEFEAGFRAQQGTIGSWPRGFQRLFETAQRSRIAQRDFGCPRFTDQLGDMEGEARVALWSSALRGYQRLVELFSLYRGGNFDEVVEKLSGWPEEYQLRYLELMVGHTVDTRRGDGLERMNFIEAATTWLESFRKPVAQGSGWRRLIATAADVEKFNRDFIPTQKGYTDMTVSDLWSGGEKPLVGRRVLVSNAALEKAERWVREKGHGGDVNEGRIWFETGGRLVAKVDDVSGTITIEDFIPLKTISTDAWMDQQLKGSEHCVRAADYEIPFGLKSFFPGIDYTLEQGGREISIPAGYVAYTWHSHPLNWTTGQDRPSHADFVQGSPKNTIAFVWTPNGGHFLYPMGNTHRPDSYETYQKTSIEDLERQRVFQRVPMQRAPEGGVGPEGKEGGGPVPPVEKKSAPEIDPSERTRRRRGSRRLTDPRGELLPEQTVRDLNEGVLAGDIQSIADAGTYYRPELGETHGALAGDYHFAIRARVDALTGLIVAVGNVQHIPEEILRRTDDVTIRVRAPRSIPGVALALQGVTVSDGGDFTAVPRGTAGAVAQALGNVIRDNPTLANDLGGIQSAVLSAGDDPTAFAAALGPQIVEVTPGPRISTRGREALTGLEGKPFRFADASDSEAPTEKPTKK